MSLSKYQSIGDNSRRDSFDYRICEDLCQTILQYLTLEEKRKLECVSKQFQRTAFLSKNRISLDIYGMDTKELEQLFKKVANLNTIVMGIREWDHHDEDNLSNDILELITKYCINLTHFEYNSEDDWFDEEVKKKFIAKFGHKLISLEIFCPEICFNLTEATNIEELKVWTFYPQLSEIGFETLKSFKVTNISSEDLDQLEVFIERNAKTLKHLDISCNEIDEEDEEDEEERNQRLLNIITKAINLVHLSVEMAFGESDKLFAYSLLWNQISINCNQIKSLKLVLDVHRNLKMNDKMLSILKQFKELKRLQLIVNYKPFIGSILDFHPFGGFTGLEGLTHLTLFVTNKSVSFKETVLSYIYITFPKLKYLMIGCPLVASEWTGEVLSRLSSLETIYLVIKNVAIIPLIETQLIQNCKHFKKLYELEEN